MIVTDSERFIIKNKLITFIELHNRKDDKHVYEIYEMIEFEEMYVLIVENFHNLDLYWIIEISLILYSINVTPRNQNKVIFYVINYIN